MPSPNFIYAFDPGVTTGYVKLSMKGEAEEIANLNKSQAYKLLDSIRQYNERPIFVVEDYRIFPGKQMVHTMTKLITAEMIGAIEYVAFINSYRFIIQQPADKLIGYKWMGARQPSDHKNSHCYDAMAHGIYYLVKNNYIKPPVTEKLAKR